MSHKIQDDTSIINTQINSLLEKDIVSTMNFEEEEINPHNEISGIYPAKNEESHAICESLLS
jgi:hypothetical protein